MQRHGWPETKAGVIRAHFLLNHEGPKFPLDAQTLSDLPLDDLPGPMPQNARDLLVLTNEPGFPAKQLTKPAAIDARPSTRASSPPPNPMENSDRLLGQIHRHAWTVTKASAR